MNDSNKEINNNLDHIKRKYNFLSNFEYIKVNKEKNNNIDKELMKKFNKGDNKIKIDLDGKKCWEKCYMNDKLEQKLMDHFKKLNQSTNKNSTFNLIKGLSNTNVEELDQCFDNCIIKYKLSSAIIEENFLY